MRGRVSGAGMATAYDRGERGAPRGRSRGSVQRGQVGRDLQHAPGRGVTGRETGGEVSSVEGRGQETGGERVSGADRLDDVDHGGGDEHGVDIAVERGRADVTVLDDQQRAVREEGPDLGSGSPSPQMRSASSRPTKVMSAASARRASVAAASSLLHRGRRSFTSKDTIAFAVRASEKSWSTI